MGAAVKIAAGLDPVTDDFAATMLAFGGQCMDSAFEAVKIV
jgi:hypothetical protein